MRTVNRLGAVALLAVGLTSCESTQPLRVETVLASINFTAANAQSNGLEVWNMIVDDNNDGQPDDGVVYRWCETPPGNQALVPSSVPWGYSVEISIIRAGSNVAQIITSEAATNDKFNVTDYGPSFPTVGQTPSKPPFACSHNPTGVAVPGQNFCNVNNTLFINAKRYTFSSPRRESASSKASMNDTGSPLGPVVAATYGKGKCSAGTPGASRLDSVPLPYTLELQKGDTIIVKARMTLTAIPNSGLTTVLSANPKSIAGFLQIDGRTVNVQGTPSGTAVSFSYTFK